MCHPVALLLAVDFVSHVFFAVGQSPIRTLFTEWQCSGPILFSKLFGLENPLYVEN